MFQKMRVQIEIPPFLHQVANGVKLVEVSGNTVGECLKDFVEQFPLSKKFLFNKDGKLFGHIELFLNGYSTYPEELKKPVHDGDTIFMLYLMIGG